MKPSHRNPLLRNLVLAASSVIGLAYCATAGTLYWDGNGTGATGNPPTAGVGGNGTWDTGTTANWWDGTAYQLWNGAGGQDIADFRGTVGTATVSGTVNANKINVLTSGYFISGGTINFPSGGIIDTNNTGTLGLSSTLSGSLVVNATASTITLAGSAGILITGNNTGLTSFELALNNANNHILIDSAGALGPAASPVKLTTGILNLGNVDGVNRTYNAWTTELAGGTIRGRFGNSTLTGPVTLTANSGMECRNGANAKLILASTATINLNANTLKLSAQNVVGTGIELNGNISGSNGILSIAGSSLTNGANGSGIVTLAGANSYTGGTNVTTSGAVLNFRKLSSLPTTGTTAMSTGTTLSLGVAASGDYFSSGDVDNLFAGTLSGNLANVTLTGTVHVGIDTSAGDFTYGTSGSVAKNLSKLGANKLTLTGNAYTGATTIYEGALALSGTGTLGTGALNMNGGNLDLNASIASIGVVTVAAAAPSGDTISNGSLTTTSNTAAAYQATNTAGNAIISANLLVNSTAGFTKTGAGGIVSLSGSNTYTGGTTVTTGTLTFLNTASKPASGTTTPAAVATLGLGVGASPTYFTASDVASLLAGTLTNVAGTNAYTVGIDTTAGDFDYSASLGTSTRALTKLGANTLTLSGTNSFDKLITVAAGTLKAGSSTAFNNTSSITVLPSSTFDLAGFNASVTNITSNTGTITTTGAGSGTDTLTVSALSAPCGNLFTDNGTRKLALTLAGSNISPLTNDSNTFSGGLNLGALMRVTAVNNNASAATARLGKGPITIGTTAQIYYTIANVTITNDITVNNNAGNGSRAGSFRVDSFGNILSGTITASGAAALFNGGENGGGSITLTGKVTGASGLTVASSNGTAMTLTLNNASANNDYAGTTTVSNTVATLALGAANQIPNGTGKGNVAVNFGKLNLGGFNETINGLSGGAATSVDNVTAANANNTLTLGDADATGSTYSGVIKNTTGTLALIKTGTGIQTLSGANLYTGNTTVNAGTLALGLATAIQNSPVITVDSGATLDVSTVAWTLGSGQTLKGNGTVTGSTTLAGTVAPGTSVGTLTMNGNTTLTGTYACEVVSATTDLLAVTGDLNITGATFALNTVTPTPGTYTIATYSGALTGTFTPSPALPTGYVLDYATTGQIKLTVPNTATPYQTWGGPYGLTAGSEGGDLDNDGLTNFKEFAFGLIPNSGASVNPITSQLSKTTGKFTYQRLAASGLTYTIWTSADLVTWIQDTGAIQTPTAAGANESVEVTLSASVPLAASKTFVRVKAE